MKRASLMLLSFFITAVLTVAADRWMTIEDALSIGDVGAPQWSSDDV